MSNGFVHLHVHSEYSLLDGAARIEDLARRAAECGMSALALTDHGVMYGAIAFYRACRKRGVKPIIGCEAYVAERSLHEKSRRDEQAMHHLVLLAKNAQGYRNLMKLCSIAFLEGFHYKPRIDFATLSQHREGLICLSGCLGGEVAQHLLQGRYEQAKETALRYRSLFGEDYYLEIQDHGLWEQKKVNEQLIRLSDESGIPLVATNDVHYIEQHDSTVQDVLLCIGTGKTIDDENRFRFQTDQCYFKNGTEMAALFPHLPQAIANTAVIADKCDLELELGRIVLPAFSPLPEGVDAPGYLRKICGEGMLERYGASPRWQDPAFREQVRERLEYELSVITEMGFADYFLIVWDFVKYAHQQGIAVGPGRGSSAGSLVAYVLRITDVDPLKYGLLFERFLNPERVSMPDIDIDFSDERRDEVIHYVVRKYGREHVAQIITFGTLAARAAIRDVGRALNLPYGMVDRVAKQVPAQPGVSIEKALRDSPELMQSYRQDERIRELIDVARKVEGIPRHTSTHAAGVVISRDTITQYTPLQTGTEQVAMTQYSMEHLEAIGMLKMDFLSLRTLSIIEQVIRHVAEQYGEKIDFRVISDEDRHTYEMIGQGDTAGVFQLESPGMRRVLRELKPSVFEDIISVVALYRPGPMEYIPRFILRKHGAEQVSYPHPALEPILKDTYGIIIYQEQIMQIASVMAGFSLGEADLLRRAISKKNREVLDRERSHFVEGCLRQGYTEEVANEVYDMIVRFADYGFPRAHATAYGVLSYRTAYLKAHYPAAFMAVLLTSVMGNHKKVAEYMDECRKMDIPVLQPDVNESDEAFKPIVKDGRDMIRFGLAAIKNVGITAIRSIMDERKERPFSDLLDFCRRVDLRVCNKRVIESLIHAGAMDGLPGNRAQKIMILDDVLEAAAAWKKEREQLQLHLFGFEERTNWAVELPEHANYSLAQQLELEKEVLGLYLSGHPLDPFREQLERLSITPIHHLAEGRDGEMVSVAGIVTHVRPVMTKKGQAMSFIQLEDRVDQAEVVIFPEVWKKYRPLLEAGAAVLVRARLQPDEDGVKLLAESVYSLHDLPEDLLKSQRVYIKIAADKEKEPVLRQLRALLLKHRGNSDVVLFYESRKTSRMLGARYRVQPSASLFQEIGRLLGAECVKVR